jgi:hypothetical protein
MPLPKLPTTGLDDINHRRRARETINQVLDHSFDDSRRQTPAEKLALITPVNYAYPPGDVRRYGSNTTPGTTDMTAAIQAAVSVAQAGSIGGYVYIPVGIYLVTSTITITKDRTHIYGDGIDATRIVFAPTANDTLFEFNNGATSVWQCSISDLTLYSNDSTYTKTALDLWDCRTFVCERVWIGGSVSVSGSSYWAGNSASIGVRTHGREFGTFRNMLIAADRPILLSENPNDLIDSDHFHFQDLFLIANANPVVEVETGLNIGNLLFDGHQSWNRGTHGVYWVDSDAPDIDAYRIMFKNVRTEQGTDSAAYSFRIERHSSSEFQDISFENVYLDTARNGLYLRRCERTTLDRVSFPGSSGVALDITAVAATTLVTRNCLFNTGSTATLTNLVLLFGTPNSPTQALQANGEYGYDANSARNIKLNGALAGTEFTLADTAVHTLGTTTMLGVLTVVVTSADNCSAVYNIRGTNNVTGELLDPQGLFTAAAGGAASHNIYWNAGTSRYELENNRGGSRSYQLFFVGRHT